MNGITTHSDYPINPPIDEQLIRTWYDQPKAGLSLFTVTGLEHKVLFGTDEQYNRIELHVYDDKGIAISFSINHLPGDPSLSTHGA